MGRLGRIMFDDYPESEAFKGYQRFAGFFKKLDETLKKCPWFHDLVFYGMIVELRFCSDVDDGLTHEEKSKIVDRANQIVRLIEDQQDGKDPDLPEVDCFLDLLAQLYAMFELNAVERFPDHPLVSPFGWILKADYCLTEKGKMTKAKVGRKKNSQSPEKMRLVAKVLVDNPKAPDSFLEAQLAIASAVSAESKRAISSRTAKDWIDAFGSLSKEERQTYIEQAKQK